MTQCNLPPNTKGSPAAQDGPAAESDVFKLIVENAVDVIVRGDAARNRIYVSPSSREILGYEPAEMLGKHAYELVHQTTSTALTRSSARSDRSIHGRI